MKNKIACSYNDIISLENLLEAWREFVHGKRHKKDVAEFGHNLTRNIVVLHEDLKNKTYKHGAYVAFAVNDPKPRKIHKAFVRDRLLHHAICRVLAPFFDSLFIADLYSCRVGKGTHKALARFRAFTRKASKNNTKTLWVLQCDIKKFFASVDQDVLLAILEKRIPDKVSIRTLASGVDFLGWVHFPDHRTLRTATKRRMFRNIRATSGGAESIQSYLGLLRHGNARKLERRISFIHNSV
ncbi:MAG: hypothetical protein AAB869_00190 [Patescibacteria group bacterium]